MAAKQKQWDLKTDEETYVDGLERKLARLKVDAPSPLTFSGPSDSLHLPTQHGADSPVGIPSDDDDDGTATEVDHPGGEDRYGVMEEMSDQDNEGKALLADIGQQAGAGTGFRIAESHPPIDFSTATLLRTPAVQSDPWVPDPSATSTASVASPSKGAKGLSRSSSAEFESDGSMDEDDEVSDEQTPTAEAKRNSIKFHDTVRIHGGIKKKQKRKKRRPTNALQFDRPVGGPRGRLPTPSGYFKDLDPPAASGGPMLDSRAGMPANLQFATSAGARGRQHSGSTSLSSSPMPLPHHLLTSNRPRRASSTRGDGYGSTTASFRSVGEGYGSGFASVLTSATQSRSTSPASSIYAPLRIPPVRAPAPFFGPTPERLARVREKKEAARREAERDKGGLWRWWWFGENKGKGRQGESFAEVADEETEGECYHDVVLEQERRKREKRLRKQERRKQRASAGLGSGPAAWFRWIWPSDGSASPSPARHLHQHSHHHGPHPHAHSNGGPSSSRGRPLSRARSSMGSTFLPDVEEHPTLVSSFTSTQTPSKAQLRVAGETAPLLDPDPITLKTVLAPPRKPKTEADVRFGKVPGRWVRASWWRWRWRMMRRWLEAKKDEVREVIYCGCCESDERDEEDYV